MRSKPNPFAALNGMSDGDIEALADALADATFDRIALEGDWAENRNFGEEAKQEGKPYGIFFKGDDGKNLVMSFEHYAGGFMNGIAQAIDEEMRKTARAAIADRLRELAK